MTIYPIAATFPYWEAFSRALPNVNLFRNLDDLKIRKEDLKSFPVSVELTSNSYCLTNLDNYKHSSITFLIQIESSYTSVISQYFDGQISVSEYNRTEDIIFLSINIKQLMLNILSNCHTDITDRMARFISCELFNILIKMNFTELCNAYTRKNLNDGTFLLS